MPTSALRPREGATVSHSAEKEGLMAFSFWRSAMVIRASWERWRIASPAKSFPPSSNSESHSFFNCSVKASSLSSDWYFLLPIWSAQLIEKGGQSNSYATTCRNSYTFAKQYTLYTSYWWAILSSAFLARRRCFHSTDLFQQRWQPRQPVRDPLLPLEVKKGAEEQMHLYQHDLGVNYWAAQCTTCQVRPRGH